MSQMKIVPADFDWEGIEDTGLAGIDQVDIGLYMVLVDTGLEDIGLVDIVLVDIVLVDIGLVDIVLEEIALEDIGLEDIDLEEIGLDIDLVVDKSLQTEHKEEGWN